MRLAILNVETGEVKWVDHGQKQVGGAADAVRDVQLSQPVWSEDGTKAVLLARAADNKDRWILALDDIDRQDARGGAAIMTMPGWMGQEPTRWAG